MSAAGGSSGGGKEGEGSGAGPSKDPKKATGKSGVGRGRGESAKIALIEEESMKAARFRGVKKAGSTLPIMDVEETSSSESSSEGEKTIRGRGGFRGQELHTIPSNITQVKSVNPAGQPMVYLSNYVKITPMGSCDVHQYRVDFEPNIESVLLRRTLFYENTKQLFEVKALYDGASDARSKHRTSNEKTVIECDHPAEKGKKVLLKIKRVGQVAWGSFEMLRLYNMQMKTILRKLGFYQVSTAGAYIHPKFISPIGEHVDVMAVRGYRTAANTHDCDQILMNFEAIHKIMQQKNVLQYMTDIRNQSGGRNLQESVKSCLIGKLVVTSYNLRVYRIEDVRFDLNPTRTFRDKATGNDIDYCRYYQDRHNVTVRDRQQPLLLVVPNQNKARREQTAGETGEREEIFLLPEFCNIAGLTDSQREDNRLKIDLIKTSQIEPSKRREQLKNFLDMLHKSDDVKAILDEWGYTYDKDALELKGRIFPLESIGVGRMANGPIEKWNKVDNQGSFESSILRESLALAPQFANMAIIIPRPEAANESAINSKLRQGFERIGLNPQNVQVYRIKEGDSAQLYSNALKNVPPGVTACVVIMSRQNKERYDTIKKLCTVELGVITQVVTSRLMMDPRKASGAAIKIGVQVAAKIGGEPWYINLPMKNAMICGYDTYHDTSKRGRSFGAFVASTNFKYSRWFSKADSHEHLDELSAHMAQNLDASLRKYRELNDKYPDRVFIYRDGVSDGQLEHVFKVEVKGLKDVVKQADEKIKLTVIVVNKRIGARFYMKNNNTVVNPPPGSVIDDTITRKERYDFYLVSQSTRHGTVAPTYYNILHDASGLSPERHQAMAFKLCFAYYNWTGTVRVPAPCQYAHKLALLCGEHLHSTPNANLDDRLHFL